MASLAGKRILIVEDEILISAMLEGSSKSPLESASDSAGGSVGDAALLAISAWLPPNLPGPRRLVPRRGRPSLHVDDARRLCFLSLLRSDSGQVQVLT